MITTICKLLATFGTIVLVYITPVIPFFFITGAFIVWDTHYGVKLAKKKGIFTSRRFSRVLYKLLVYNIVVVSCFAVEKHILTDFVKHLTTIDLALTKVGVLVVLINELFSIDEKLIGLTGEGLFAKMNKIYRKVSSFKTKINKLK